jgi:23S rRNA (uracil1939-C5)-methyltransferase
MTRCQSIHAPCYSLNSLNSVESHLSGCYLYKMTRKVQVRIESVGFKGYGVARIDGKVVFVPHTVTGDKAWIEIMEEKKKYSMGRLIQIVEPSPWRTNPPCPYFESCGGCQWQHIDDLIQGELKKKILGEILKRLGKLREIPLISVALSPKPYHYRVRVQLKVEGNVMGYYQERSHKIVEIDRCRISHPLVNHIIQGLRDELAVLLCMEEIEINVSPGEGRGILIFHPHSYDQRINYPMKGLLQSQPILRGIAVAKKGGLDLFGDPTLNLMIPLSQEREKRNLTLRISPKSFFQVNLEQNQALIQTVLQFSEVNQEDRVLDLYAGVGNLTLPLAMRAKEVLGVEENGMAVEDARSNAERNGITNCDFIQGRVEDSSMGWKRKRADLVVLDPPRTGCKTILDQVVGLTPKKIVYVSCEPTAFSRDLDLLSRKGYSLKRLGLIDMFPQTYHMEVIGLLQPS